MNFFLSSIFRYLGSLTLALISVPSLGTPSSGIPTKFSIESPPSRGDWQRFHILTTREQRELWTYHQKRQVTLNKWAWQWRLGWMQVCGTPDNAQWCSSILEAGLRDPAAVVRAEAAKHFATAKKNTATKRDVNLLVKAYERSDNLRNGRHLFVSEEILKALASLNLPAANAEAARLARKNKKTLAYWRALKKGLY